jgi:hypothetical protein
METIANSVEHVHFIVIDRPFLKPIAKRHMAFAAIACVPENFIVGERFVLRGWRRLVLVLVLGRHDETTKRRLCVCVIVESG